LQIIIKGLKGKYEPVIDWYKEILINCNHLMNILDNKDEGWTNMKQMLDIFKVGIYCKHSEVVLWACKLLTKMAAEIHIKQLSGPAWDWFVSNQTGCLQNILYCLKNTKSIAFEVATPLLCEFGKYNYVELFTHYLKRFCKQDFEYFSLAINFIQPLAENKIIKEEIANAKIIPIWIDYALKKGDSDANPNCRLEDRSIILSLLFEIWSFFPNIIEVNPEYADNIIKMAQRANRDKNESLQVISLTLLFNLMDHFAKDKKPYAPIVYKTLTFALVENHQKTKIREIILNNFKVTFEMFPNIPASIILEPYIKQVKIIVYILLKK